MISTSRAAAAFAQPAASSMTSCHSSSKSGDQSSGRRSLISKAITGLLGSLPSKYMKGIVVSPPTVTVEVRVPPSAFVAPKVTSRTCPDQLSLRTGVFVSAVIQGSSDFIAGLVAFISAGGFASTAGFPFTAGFISLGVSALAITSGSLICSFIGS